MTDSNPENKISIIAQVEALLFIAPASVSISQLAAALEARPVEVEEALQALEAHYKENPQLHGLRLQRHAGRLQLTSCPEAAQAIENLLGLALETRLSQAALETLAIVMYKQPITRPQVEAVRGVNSDSVMRTLLSRGLVQEVGRSEAPGRPILYSLTEECLQYFGLSSLAELPPLEIENQPLNGENDELLKD